MNQSRRRRFLGVLVGAIALGVTGLGLTGDAEPGPALNISAEAADTNWGAKSTDGSAAATEGDDSGDPVAPLMDTNW